MQNIIYVLLGSFILSGCSMMGLTEQKIVQLDTSKEKSKGLEIASFPTQIRGAYIYTGTNGEKYVCAEPFADVAASSSLNATASAINNLSSSLNKSLNVSAKRSGDSKDDNTSYTHNNDNSFGNTFGASAQTDQNINLGLNAINEIVALEGRTQFVLLAREMLFRTCEAAANGELDSNNSVVAKQHSQIFTALTAMINTQKVKAEAEKSKAEAEKTKAILKATDKLDPEILKVFADNSLKATILDIYLEEYTKCIEREGASPKEKEKCKKTYNTNLQRLGEN